ncbi:MAG: transporter substrate-binding domain-containing protein [Aliidongia sp.]
MPEIGGVCRNLWVLALVGFCLLAMPADADCVLSVRTHDDPPYSMIQPEELAGGISIDIVREGLRRIGCSVSFEDLPFARALASLRQGNLAVLPGVFRTPEREAFALFSAPVNAVPNKLFIRRADVGRWHVEKLADLIKPGFRLGVQIDVMYSAEYRQLLDNPAFQALLAPTSSRSNLWQMLAANRIDGVIADDLTARWEIHAAGYDAQIVPQGFVVSAEPSYVAFSRALVSLEQVANFDKALRAMHEDGTYDAILQRYGPSYRPPAARLQPSQGVSPNR